MADVYKDGSAHAVQDHVLARIADSEAARAGDPIRILNAIVLDLLRAQLYADDRLHMAQCELRAQLRREQDARAELRIELDRVKRELQQAMQQLAAVR